MDIPIIVINVQIKLDSIMKGDEISPVVSVLKKYPELTAWDIIRQVGDWHFANGKVEFDKAVESGLIVKTGKTDYNGDTWKLANP